MTAPVRAPSASAGFSLVELLVVLAIFGLMSVLLFDSLHFASRASIAGNARLDRTRDVALASAFLRRQLADIRPLPDSPQETGRQVAFEGGPSGLDFVAALPGYLAPGGFQSLRVALETGRSGSALTLRWQPLGGETADNAKPAPSVLLDGLSTADFSYFGPTAPREPPDWHATWSGATGLPMLIRLKLVFADGYAPPELIVAPRPAEAAFQ